MKHPLFAAALALVAANCALAQPASAQDRAQITRAAAGASCPGCNLFQADLTYRELGGRDYSRARLRQADLSFGTYARTKFGGADLRDVNAAGAVFSSADFTGANLTNATLVGSHFAGATFTGANLNGVNLAGAELAGARGLTQRQLDRACGDETTRLPRGLRIPRC